MTIIRNRILICSIVAACACSKAEGDLVTEEDLEAIDDAGLLQSDIASGSTDKMEPVLLPAGECVQVPVSKVYGYQHQCEGEISVSFGAGDIEGQESFMFGPKVSNDKYWVDPDSYDKPLVAACCGSFDYTNPTPEDNAPYVSSCMFDAVQQVCQGLPYFLRKQAEEESDDAKKAQIDALAASVDNKTKECLKALWAGGPPGPGGTSTSELAGTSWSPVTDATITIDGLEIHDWTQAGDLPWRTCSGMFENDDAVIPTTAFKLPGASETTRAVLVPGSIMTGVGPLEASGVIVPWAFASSLTIADMSDMSVRISGLQLRAGYSAMMVLEEHVQLKRASVTLRNPIVPSEDEGEYTVAPGAANFVATAVLEGGGEVVEGDSRIIDMVNQGPIVFRKGPAGEWVFDPFELVYEEPHFGPWALRFDGLIFRPASG
ncbi:hypothetical protein DB30_06999 [Enhygromyxa salina]|uniref:Uncharacterized protein n=1 Tax=Enhygromyxa salina TaxID=215803 RepID=A0A0C2CXB9_9BACT|nr:hypothetical protein [Enhygromyxa salina]KIG14250.1 hypothetical protein DB30_06999 [Enhygromyxa salina]